MIARKLYHLILRLLRIDRPQGVESWDIWEDMCDSYNFPRVWVVCPTCGQQAWRFPPHSFDPCPLVVQTAEAAGMRFDAERMTAVRSGVHIEALTQMLKEHFGEDEE